MLRAPAIVPGKSDDERLKWWQEWTNFLHVPSGHFAIANDERVHWNDHLFLGWETHFEMFRSSRAVGVADGPFTDSVEYGEVSDLLTWRETSPAPLLIHKKLLREHAYVKGPTGGGKTSLGIIPLAVQLLRGTNTPAGRTKPITMLIFDFKGDPALFHTIKLEAEARGQRFRFFTTEKDRATHLFNPFRGFDRRYRTVPQLCQLVLDTLGLNFGRLNGRGYYTERSRYLLSLTLKRHPRVSTFPELHTALRSTVATIKDMRAKSDAFELLSVIECLTEYPQLVTNPELDISAADNVIFMPRVIEEREVVYFSLPMALESIGNGEIGKLGLFNLRVAAQDWIRNHPDDPREITLIADEAQHLVGDNIRAVLQDARSFGISVILANQSLKDLRSPSGVDLGPTVMTNSRLKLFFNSPSETDCYVYVERGKGFTEARQYPERGNPWLRVLGPEEFAYHARLTWAMSREEYERRQALPWPSWEEVPGGNPWLDVVQPSPGSHESEDVSVPELKFVRDDEWKQQVSAIRTLFSSADRKPKRQDDVIQDLLLDEESANEDEGDEE